MFRWDEMFEKRIKIHIVVVNRPTTFAFPGWQWWRRVLLFYISLRSLYMYICYRAEPDIKKRSLSPCHIKKRVQKKGINLSPGTSRERHHPYRLIVGGDQLFPGRDGTPYGARFDPSFAVDADSGELTPAFVYRISMYISPKCARTITTPSPIHGFTA